MKTISIVLSFIFFCTYTLLAQEDTDFQNPDQLEIPTDSTSAPIERGTLKTLKTIFQGKPGKAALYGLVIPGGGQIYNKRYWKAPIVWAADGVAIWYFLQNRSFWIGFKDAYALSFTDSNASFQGISGKSNLREFRNQFQLDTERAGIAIIVIHFISVLEAFTDSHLMDFDISEDLSFQMKTETIPLYGAQSSLGVHYTF